MRIFIMRTIYINDNFDFLNGIRPITFKLYGLTKGCNKQQTSLVLAIIYMVIV